MTKVNSKTRLALGLTLAILVVGSIAAAYATPLATQNPAGRRDYTCTRDRTGSSSSCPNFVDADKDGVCDNCIGTNAAASAHQHRLGRRS